MEYVGSVGMEVHAQLLTKSKMFCACPTSFGEKPNTNVCPVCLGLPGALPIANKRAVEHVIRTSLALNCQIAPLTEFYRKNYFYPDLPKGYQISQYGDLHPIGQHGWLEIPTANGKKKIHIRRVHLEEDTGKLLHLIPGESEVDFNRCGMPLMEIVTEFPPDIENAEEAKEYLVQLRAILTYIGASEARMEAGQLRCEPNISVRPFGSSEYGVKTELKNLNSFRSVQRGIEYEIERQIAELKAGGRIIQETRGWNEALGNSFVMRVKEHEQDYRYFPEPDLTPIRITSEWIEEIRSTLPELPLAKLERYQSEYALSAYDAGVLTADRATAEYFEACIALGADAKTAANWITGDLAAKLNETGVLIDAAKATPNHLVELIKLIESNAITGRVAKDVFAEAFATGDLPSAIVQREGLTQIADNDALVAIARKVIEANPDAAANYRNGKETAMGFLKGQAMKETRGRANPQAIEEALKRELSQ
ncbi:MAG: Asp-tRNA(Asn)/Glu-tRNA(Gln) amidotransferase subunit GatB [Armatimonadetes bacterium]|nr:Asp-tRNA(Asn)/Glu-tRNA(Gln) amidotransferase subunit GatB [Armatimonadota bacterium]